MMMICFSTVSPGRKLWSLLVKWPGLPRDVGEQGLVVAEQVLAHRRWGTQSDRSISHVTSLVRVIDDSRD